MTRVLLAFGRCVRLNSLFWKKEIHMFKFLRENPTIAFGLGLPLLLVVAFLLMSGIPTLLVDDPKYDVLYATDYNNYPTGVQISVIDNKVQVVYQGNAQVYQTPHIWRYNPRTGGVKEVGYVLPPGLTATGQAPNDAEAKTTVIDVPDLQGLQVDSSSIAPDGYEFRIGSNGYSRSLFEEVFYSSRSRHELVLAKNGRQLRLPQTGDRYYSYNTHFIGWVISP